MAAEIVRDRVIHRVLRRKVEQYGNREFFRCANRVFGYQDLDRESSKWLLHSRALVSRKETRSRL